jgi:hypothetical protein
MKKLLLASVAVLLAAQQPAHAVGCIEGAAIGGVIGHMKHHTFWGMFGGCVAGRYVHHMYAKWKKAHPQGTMNEFVTDNKDYLPEGWADRLTQVGDSSDLRAGRAPRPTKPEENP